MSVDKISKYFFFSFLFQKKKKTRQKKKENKTKENGKRFIIGSRFFRFVCCCRVLSSVIGLQTR
jgi:hypothetical protein